MENEPKESCKGSDEDEEQKEEEDETIEGATAASEGTDENEDTAECVLFSKLYKVKKEVIILKDLTILFFCRRNKVP